MGWASRRPTTTIASRGREGKTTTKTATTSARGGGKKSARELKPSATREVTRRVGEVTARMREAAANAPRPALYAGGALVLFVFAKVLFGRGKKGSLGDLEERGMLDENRDVDEDKFYQGMMKGVRTMEMPELTEEQILAARERRRQSAAGNDNFEKSLAEVDIPANHPWATKENVSAAEQLAEEQRVLEINRPRKRRGAPPPQ